MVGLVLYTVTVVRESCVRQQGSTLRRRQQNRIELYALEKPEAEVTNNKKNCARGIILLKLTTDRHEASRGLFATAELLVFKIAINIQWNWKLRTGF